MTKRRAWFTTLLAALCAGCLDIPEGESGKSAAPRQRPVPLYAGTGGGRIEPGYWATYDVHAPDENGVTRQSTMLIAADRTEVREGRTVPSKSAPGTDGCRRDASLAFVAGAVRAFGEPGTGRATGQRPLGSDPGAAGRVRHQFVLRPVFGRAPGVACGGGPRVIGGRSGEGSPRGALRTTAAPWRCSELRSAGEH